MAAICLTSLLTLAFIFIGQVNVLAPIVSINFMLTYSFIDYSYFSVVMTSLLETKDKKKGPLVTAKTSHRPSRRQSCRPLIEVTLPKYGSAGSLHLNGTLLEFTKDMDHIFPPTSNSDVGAEKVTSTQPLRGRCKDGKANVTTKQKLMDSFRLDHKSNTFSDEKQYELSSSREEAGVQCADREPHAAGEQQNDDSGVYSADKSASRESLRHLTGDPH